jgi:23S rRNA pseudouridine1911/1915/1917 synthase
VAARLGAPRNQVQRWIADGRVQVDGAAAKPSLAVGAGSAIRCEPAERGDDRIVPEAGELPLLHVDPQLVVLDKPAGLTVHPGAGRRTGTLVHRLVERFPEMAGVGGEGRPGIVHRLDQGTSGAMVVARTAEAYAHLARVFAERLADKRYLAIVYGAPRPPRGTVDAAIGRHPQRRKEMAVRREGRGGRTARTGYSTLAACAGIALVELHLETGRTHQIRVHMKSLGHPLVGDPIYGEARWKGAPKSAQTALRDFARPALHAWKLAFPHPASGEAVAFTAPIPDDLRQLWRGATGTELPVPAKGGE